MRIACPECNAAYDVPAAQLAPGRGVRCVRCGSVWVPVATENAVPEIQPQPELPRPVPPVIATGLLETPEPEAAPPPGRMTEPAGAETATDASVPAVAPSARRRAPPVLVGWLVTVLVLAELVYVAARYPGAVMRAWPPSERAYALFGVGQAGEAAGKP